MIARCRNGEEVVYGDGRGSKCAFGANIIQKSIFNKIVDPKLSSSTKTHEYYNV